ncbi:helix-turn-helix domain-containing protein [Streptomyces sp. NBC_00457]|uniref:helix-turn-helix domain-containing protein n=1 Tax=Streptomyces sp. NBC_00457 TaxID=2975748 RepID=UPI002E23899E
MCLREAGESVATGESQQAQQNWRYCGGQIKLWREESGVSRQRLADEAGYDYEYVKSMECGRRRPTLGLLQVADQMCGARGKLLAGQEFLNPSRRGPRSTWRSRPRQSQCSGTSRC